MQIFLCHFKVTLHQGKKTFTLVEPVFAEAAKTPCLLVRYAAMPTMLSILSLPDRVTDGQKAIFLTPRWLVVELIHDLESAATANSDMHKLLQSQEA